MSRVPTDDDRRKAKAARAMNRAATRPTTRPGSETTTLVVGDTIAVERGTGPTGTWGRYAGRIGTVVAVNGHAYTPHNTYVDKCGHRVCRACHREHQRRYLERGRT